MRVYDVQRSLAARGAIFYHHSGEHEPFHQTLAVLRLEVKYSRSGGEAQAMYDNQPNYYSSQ